MPDWIVPDKVSATGDATVLLRVSPNTAQARTGKFKASGAGLDREVTVNQNACIPFTVTPDSFDDIPYEGGRFTIDIQCGGRWTIDNRADWCVFDAAEGEGSCTLGFTVSANGDRDNPRTGSFVVSDGASEIEVSLIQNLNPNPRLMPDKILRAYMSYYGYIEVLNEDTGEIRLTEKGLATAALTLDLIRAESFAGLEFFPSLKSLRMMGTPNLKFLDLHEFPALEEVVWGDNDNLEWADLRCATLRSVSVPLDQPGSMPKLKMVDLSGCPYLMQFGVMESLIEEIDLSGVPQLSTLVLSGTPLKSLDLSKCPAITTLKCKGAHLSSLDLSALPSLELLVCGGPYLETLDVSNNPKLRHLGCDDSRVSSLDLSGLPALEVLFASGTRISRLDFSNNPKFASLYVESTPIEEIDLSGHEALRSLRCYDCPQLEKLDISGTKPTMLYLVDKSNALTINSQPFGKTLNISPRSGVQCGIKELVADDMADWIIVISEGNTNIEKLSLRNCPELKTVTLTDNSALTHLDITGTDVTSLTTENNAPGFTVVPAR